MSVHVAFSELKLVDDIDHPYDHVKRIQYWPPPSPPTFHDITPYNIELFGFYICYTSKVGMDHKMFIDIDKSTLKMSMKQYPRRNTTTTQ